MAPRRPHEIDLEPIRNADRERGASPQALRELGVEPDEEADDGERASRPAKPGRRAASPERAPRKSAPAFGPEGRVARGGARDDAPEGDGPPVRAKRGGRPAKENRVQRAIRLSSTIDAKLHELAESRGIDLNAAVSVAIAEDWRRSCRDDGRGP